MFLIGFSLDCIFIFPSLTFTYLILLVSWGYVGILFYMSVALPPDKLADIQELALSFLQTQPVTVHRFIFFLMKVNFCAYGHP